MIKCSILTSLYYKESPEFFNTAIKSLANQTRKPDEIIVVVEGTLSGEMMEIVDYWIHYFGAEVFRVLYPGNLAVGFPSCLNFGLHAARFDIIIRVDTDDYSEPTRIEEQMRMFENDEELTLLSAYLPEYDENLSGNIVLRKVPLQYKDIVRFAKWRNPINHPVAAYRRKVAVLLGGYPLVGSNEDYAFFCMFLKNKYKALNQDKYLVKARTGAPFLSRRRGTKYLNGELECLKYIYSIGFFSPQIYLFHILSRKIVRNLPTRLLSVIYTFLRKK